MLNIKLRKKQDARASEETRALFDISKKKKGREHDVFTRSLFI